MDILDIRFVHPSPSTGQPGGLVGWACQPVATLTSFLKLGLPLVDYMFKQTTTHNVSRGYLQLT